MAKGRRPRPAYLRGVDGNPGKRKEPDPPKPPPQVKPKPLSSLGPEARKIFRRILRAAPEGTIAARDEIGLSIIAMLAADVDLLTEDIAENEATQVSAKSGYEMQRPAVSIRARYLTLLRGYLTDYGLNPAGAARLAPPKEKEGDPLHQHLNELEKARQSG